MPLAWRARGDMRIHSSSRCERALALRFLLLFEREALLLLLEPRRSSCLPTECRAAIELEDPAGDVVEEVAVVRDRDDRARVLLQEVLEPGDRLGVEVVRRLVEEQQVGRLQQQPAQRDAAALAAGQRRHVGVGRRQAQRVHRVLELRVEVPGAGGLDRVLHARLLGEELVHLLGRHLLAELRVDLVEARQQRARRRDALLDVAEHGLRRVELSAPAPGSRR